MLGTDISYAQIDAFIEAALYEDVGEADHTSEACIPAGKRDTAILLAKDVGILAGAELAAYIFKQLDPSARFDLHIADGRDIVDGDRVFAVEADTRILLKAERLVLNLMQRMSGIATLSNRFAVEVEGLPTKILDTRKTTPLLRFLEKWAVRIGGCHNYRWGLYDRIMLKDNHIDAAGGVRQALERAAAYQAEKGLDLEVTLEVRNLVELYEALDTGLFDRVMFDNFELPIMAEAVAHVAGAYETEASGGITLHTVRAVAETGVDFISVGALTHSYQSLDLSLKIKG